MTSYTNNGIEFNTIKTGRLLTCTRYLGSKFKYGDKGLIPVTERKKTRSTLTPVSPVTIPHPVSKKGPGPVRGSSGRSAVRTGGRDRSPPPPARPGPPRRAGRRKRCASASRGPGPLPGRALGPSRRPGPLPRPRHADFRER